MTTPDQPKPPTVLKFRSASGRTEIARRPDGTISLHVLAGHDVLADGDIVAAAAALVAGEQAAYERGVAKRLRAEQVNVLTRNAYEDGKGDGRADGRRQATEGWEREWGVYLEPDDLWPYTGVDDEADARHLAAQKPGRRVVSRLAGPWEAAEQTSEPCGIKGPHPAHDDCPGWSFPEQTQDGAR